MTVFIKSFLDQVCFSSYKVINAITLYLVLCMVIGVVLAIIRIIVFLTLELFKNIFKKLEVVVLGKHHEKSLEYKFISLWYIKFESDFCYFVDWIKYDVVKTYLTISYSSKNENNLIASVRSFSIDNLVQIIKRIFKYFIDVTGRHIIILIAVMYYFYNNYFINFVMLIKNLVIQNKIAVEDVLDLFGLMTIVFTGLYIVLDVRHKASGYTGLREVRFKELIVLEEKLLLVMQEMSYSLDKNIELLCKRKKSILQEGAASLCGKECYIDKNNIKYYDEPLFVGVKIINSSIFSEFDDINEGFQKLTELEDEFKESSLNHSNIYLVDYKTMLTRVGHIWHMGYNNKNYSKMDFFCKSCMEKWYNNVFVKATSLGDRERKFLSEESAKATICYESSVLDFELQRALVLELYVRKYKRKIIKRMKKIHRFSRFSIL